MLWNQVMNEWQAAPWLQKLQQNVLFWLQIIALILLMLALTKPFWYINGLKGDHIIFVVDPSASMSAIDKGEMTRFDSTKREILEMLKQRHNEDITMIIAGERPDMILNREKDGQKMNQTVKNLTLTYGHENMDRAFKLAESVAKDKQTVIHVFSDHVKETDLASTKTLASIHVHNIGEKQDNLSIVSLGVAPQADKIIGAAVIENQMKSNKRILLSVHNEANELYKKEVIIPAHEQVVIQIPDLPKSKYYKAQINSEDIYPVDDQMVAIYQNERPTVFAIGHVNPFFIKGLQTIGIDAVQLRKEDEWDKVDGGIVLTEGLPEKEWPNRPLIVVNKGDKKRLDQSVTTKKDPLLEFVELNKVYIQQASAPIKGNWETIASSGDRPLIQKGMRNGYPIIQLNFALEDSDWPLQPSFPIFLYNSYQWLSQQSQFLGYFQPGEEKWLNLGQDGSKQEREIFTEDGKSLFTYNVTKESFRAPRKPGVYEAVAGNSVYYFSVLLDDREKSIVSASSFTLENEQATKKQTEKKQYDQLWLWLSVIVFGVLLIEWEVYRRGLRG